MVRAILNGNKTQTRRKINLSKNIEDLKIGFSAFTPDNHVSARGIHEDGRYGESFLKVKVHKDDIFWVRETFSKLCPTDDNGYTDFNKEMIFYKADGEPDIVKYDADGFELEDQSMKWKPSIFMPKEACRIFLKVTNIRIEKLQDISEYDAIHEGIIIGDGLEQYMNYGKGYKWVNSAVESFESLWQSINGEGSWQENPFVWVYDFEVIDKPLNFL